MYPLLKTHKQYNRSFNCFNNRFNLSEIIIIHLDETIRSFECTANRFESEINYSDEPINCSAEPIKHSAEAIKYNLLFFNDLQPLNVK